MFHPKAVLVVSAIAACITLAPVALMAQTSTGTNSGTTSGTVSSNVSADRMADSYSASFGTRDDAKTAIEGLRAGKDVTQGGVTVSGTGTTMGYGNVNIALSLAQAQAKAQAGEDATTKEFLTALDQVMDKRASGMGWGQIAKDLGFNLGQVVSGSKSSHASSAKAGADKPGKASNMADAGKASSQGRGGAGMGGTQGQGGGNGNGKGDSAGGNAGGGGNSGGGGGGGGGKK